MKNVLTPEFQKLLADLAETLLLPTIGSIHYKWMRESIDVFKKFSSDELTNNSHFKREVHELHDILEKYSNPHITGNEQTSEKFHKLYCELKKLHRTRRIYASRED